MKERPILFSGGMIRAILAGRKSQTRRIVKPQLQTLVHSGWLEESKKTRVAVTGDDASGEVATARCPYGIPGDILWVREAIYVQPEIWKDCRTLQPIHYAADCERGQVEDYILKPSIHMPRWASRITLEIVDVRVERLQEISEADAQAEGITGEDALIGQVANPWVTAYAALWESINGKGSWAANPFCWCLSFRRLAQ